MASAAIALMVLGVVGGTAAWKLGRSRGVLGTVVVTGTASGDASFEVKSCRRLQDAGPESFGVDLRGSGGHVVRLVTDGREVRMWLHPKGSMAAAIPINRADCSEWDVRMAWKDPATMALVSGHATFTCAVGGGKINATIFFDCPRR